MISKKAVIAFSMAAGLFVAAALFLDVDIRLKNARAAAVTPSSGEWSPTEPYPVQEVYYPGVGDHSET
ncbi:MAG: hypothetical protein JRH19_28785 [Deltaproteobacteria bacterium]|nr:hypothetical protein [Deltaproteobacteria bacterium]